MGRPRLIDRRAVLDASLRIADARGLDALTMGAVASELGVTPMALYRHVEGKGDLLDGVVESLLHQLPEPAPHQAWDEALAAMGQALRATARRHPSVFPLLMALPATTAGARRAREGVYRMLRAAGVSEADVPQLERLVSTMVLGFAASEASGRFGRHPRSVIDADWAALEQIVRATVDRYTAG